MQNGYLTPPASTMNKAKELSTKFEAEMAAYAVISVYLRRKQLKEAVDELVEYKYLDRSTIEETLRHYVAYQDYVLYPESDYDGRGLAYYKQLFEQGVEKINALVDAKDYLSEYSNESLKKSFLNLARDIDWINDDLQRILSRGEFGKFAYADLGACPYQF